MNTKNTKNTMNKNIVKLNLIVAGTTAVTNDPSTSISQQIGAYKDEHQEWRFSKELMKNCLVLTKDNCNSKGQEVLYKVLSLFSDDEKIIVPKSTLAIISAIALYGGSSLLLAAAIFPFEAGVIGGLALLGVGGGCLGIEEFKNRKQLKTEKDRMYREIIKNQQAAIRQQKEINRKLEEELRKAQNNLESNQKEIESLRQRLKNLEEAIDVLTQQKQQFGKMKNRPS